MKVISDVHQQFAEYFPSEVLRPYLYILSKKLSEGHICVEVDKIDKEELSAVGYDTIISKKKLQREPLVSDGEEVKPITLFKDRLYLQRYFNYETIILDRIRKFIDNESLEMESKAHELKKQTILIKGLFKNSTQDIYEKEDAINWPLVAAITAVLNNFTIITGAPGTGKTTTVAKILTILYSINPALKVALAAPTGKAAARMAESLKNAILNTDDLVKSKFAAQEAYTIHRLLGPIKNTPHFKHNKENTLNYDVVIVDESSMIDVALFAKLLDAIGSGTKLILLGDKDQLASVEAGSLLGDLCLAQKKLNSFSKARAEFINRFITEPSHQISSDHIDTSVHPLFEHVIELKHSHRFSNVKGIGKFSKAIIQSNEPAIKDFFSNSDEQVIIDTAWNEKIFEEFIAGYEAFIREKDIVAALQKLNQLRVLCVVREGEHGLYAINKKIEKYLQKNKLIRLTGEFYEHRPIMLTSNNYELQLFNGDIGIVRPGEKGDLKAWFETGKGEVKAIPTGYISQAETVYAMTIHKSQGSEFDKVLVSLPENENIAILTRELLYTAVTRAKHKVIVQGSESVILQASKAFVKRGSGIIERFIN
jgi:exodeoxyribonuclease V alpha subunit